MEADRRQLWASYFTHLANKMGLYDWRILLSAQTPQEASKEHGEEVAACIKCIYGKKVAYVYLYAAWDDDEPEDQRSYAVHELVHPHFEQSDEYVHQLTITHFNDRDAEWHSGTFRYLMEFGVDALAKIIARSLNLPGDVLPELGKQEPEQTKIAAKKKTK